MAGSFDGFTGVFALDVLSGHFGMVSLSARHLDAAAMSVGRGHAKNVLCEVRECDITASIRSRR